VLGGIVGYLSAGGLGGLMSDLVPCQGFGAAVALAAARGAMESGS
jgi:hypothetical protein